MSDEEERRIQMFMAHLPEKEFDFLEEKVKLWDTDYCIGFEKTPYEHFHFIAYITDTEYHNFCQNIFKKHYNLRGKPGRKGTKDEGKGKQYGRKLEKINSEERVIQYTLKDGNFRTNMDKDLIEKLVEQSFKKNEKERDIKRLFEHLDKEKYGAKVYQHFNEYGTQETYIIHTTRQILEKIYKFIIENKDIKLSLSRTAINNYFLKYLRTTQNIKLCDKVRYAMSFNNHN
jgi:hypothetical protein